MKGFYERLNAYFEKINNSIKGLFQTRRLKKNVKKKNRNSWGLGVDAPFFFSSKFTIKNKSITITGSQWTHDYCLPIMYSIIKMSKLGFKIKYFDSIVFYGDYSKEEFKHTFTSLPDGPGYQLEIFNYCRYHSCGKVRVIQNESVK